MKGTAANPIGRSPTPLRRAAAAHAAAVLLTAIAACGLQRLNHPVALPVLAVMEGFAAAVIGLRLELPPWWLPIQLLFAPAVYAVQHLDIDPAYYLAAFAVTAVLSGDSIGSRVPLYPSSRTVWRWLAGVVPGGGSMIDLGCSTGSGLIAVARSRPDVCCVGVEASPALWLVAWLRTRRISNCKIVFGRLWRVDLERFDIAYAFLSPAPMESLWRKAGHEMRPGSMLISNSFLVPNLPPDRTVEMTDRRRSRLHLWRIRFAARQPDVRLVPSYNRASNKESGPR